MTQELARVFEAGITAHPADWHMLQRVFVADLDPDRLAAAAAAAGGGDVLQNTSLNGNRPASPAEGTGQAGGAAEGMP